MILNVSKYIKLIQSHLNYVNVFQSVHGVLANEVLYVNDVFMREGKQNPHFAQGSLKRFLV